MNKSRLEAFSDGVFSIVMTLLVFDIKLPAGLPIGSETELVQQLVVIAPHIAVYFVSFAVLSVLWINHHFLFHTFAKSVDRWLNLLNLAYLMFVAFIPFSADLIGEYHTFKASAIVYGLNVFIIVALSSAMIAYMRKHPEELLGDASPRLMSQARFRGGVSLFCYIIGIALSFVSIPLSLFFYAFPIIFNIIPGTLNMTERIFGFTLGPIE